MSTRRTLALVPLLLLPSPLAGQAPTVTSAGDPSVDADTLYALASDTLTYPEQAVLTLFDDGIVRLEEDGTWSETFRMVRQVLRREAIRSLTELTFGYDANRAEFTLNWARVIDPDSGVVSDSPLQIQETDVPASAAAPVYTDQKTVRASLGSVAVGRMVDWSYTVRHTAPVLPGDLWQGWRVKPGTPVRRSRFLLDTPRGVEPRIREVNLQGPTKDVIVNGRRVREWSYAEIEPFSSEPFAADSNAVQQSITVTGWLSWDDIARWYRDLAFDRMKPTPTLVAKVRELTPEGADASEALRAIHRWITRDIRYLSISFDIGGYQPRPPDEVISTLSGDCKDVTTLFVTMARALGAEAYPVLVSTGGDLWPDHPSLSQFNHMIAAVRVDQEWRYVDLTVAVASMDDVFVTYQGEQGLLVRDDGSAEIVSFPLDPASANRSTIEVSGEIRADGTFSGTYTESVTGAIQYRLRSEFSQSLTEEELESVGRGIAARIFNHAWTDSLEVFDGLDLSATPRLRASVSAEGVLRETAGGWILPLRIPTYGSRPLIDFLKRDTVRSFPIDSELVFGLREHLTILRFTLPEGWSAELPAGVLAQGPFGTYESSYVQDGRILEVRRMVRGTRGIFPEDHVKELVAWLEAMANDTVEFIVLRSQASAGPPGYLTPL